MPIETAAPEAPVQITDRCIGAYDQGIDGPTLLVAAGLHGNEPSGIHAFRRVIETLQRSKPAIRGRVVGFAGNLVALERGTRFVDEDLNRIWSRERVDRLRAPGNKPTSVEQAQQLELLASLETELAGSRGPVSFLDLHTSSAPGKPFVCTGDTLRNRKFALQLAAPVILGLEEQVDGALLELVNNLGYVTVGVEGGQHDHPSSVDFHEAFVLLGLAAAGCMDAAEIPGYETAREHLREAAGSLPRMLEVRSRHPVREGDGFVMEPGYVSFQTVRAGELMARDAEGVIEAEEAGRVLLPLYQGQGDDGFFLMREFRPFWLAVSAWARRLGLPRLAHWLPGVHRDPEALNTLVIDRAVARWYAVEIFHLLGFRKERAGEAALRFSRRVE